MANQSREQEGGARGGEIQQREQSRGMARRGDLPSLLAVSPREFFSMSPFQLMRRMSEEMDRMFSATAPTMWAPAIEVFERDNNLVVRAELPGLNKEEVKVEATDEGLVIQGERKREQEEKGERYYRSERSYGQFYRLIPLPEGASAEQARASFNNGVLEVSIPVAQAQQKRKEIQIGTGAQEQPKTRTGGGGQG